LNEGGEQSLAEQPKPAQDAQDEQLHPQEAYERKTPTPTITIDDDI
jgi:hypothetical protein